jgi:SAM-dependent methyltransferase
VTEFYDDLAETYDLIYPDWWAAAVQTGEVLTTLLADETVRPPARVLDCTCGIGTQALPLAAGGYLVTATDISEPSVRRARREATARGLTAEFLVADVRDVATQVDGQFDAVVSADNSLPHLLTDDDLITALRSIRRCLRAGGILLATIRDYDQILRDGVTGVPPRIHGTGAERRIICQAWEWAADRRTLTMNHIMLTGNGSGWDANVRTTTYRALRRVEFDEALAASGFTDARWLFPDESGYYQPVVLARAAG